MRPRRPTAPRTAFPIEASYAHGHYDVAVAAGPVAEGTELAGGLFVLQLEADRAIRGGGEKIEQVLRVETDGDGLAFVFFLDGFFGFAVLGTGGGNLQAFLGQHELYGVRALVGELRNAAKGVLKLAAFDGDG